MKIFAIAKVGFKECLGYKLVYFIFLMALLFILLGRSCSPGEITGNDILFDAQARQNLAMKVAFNGIVLWSIMLCGLLAANILSKELEEGTAVITLSRPISRALFAAGKLLSVLMVSVLNLFLLGFIFFVLFYFEAGYVNYNIFAGFFLMILNMLMYALMLLLCSLYVPRFITPMIGIFIYLTSCWTALPFYFSRLKLLWIPSDTITNMHTYLPRFGDLQLISASYIDSAPPLNDLTGPLASVLFYCLAFWFLILSGFKKKQV